MQVPIMALTATATQKVVTDVQGILRIEGCEVFRSDVNRPNLFYEARNCYRKLWNSIKFGEAFSSFFFS